MYAETVGKIAKGFTHSWKKTAKNVLCLIKEYYLSTKYMS